MNFTESQVEVFEKPTIKCHDVEELLGDYSDRDLSVSLRERFDNHIAHCASCQELKETYQAVISLASELRDVPVDHGVQNRLREALNRKLGLKIPLIE